MVDLGAVLFMATLMVVVTVAIHFFGVTAILALLRRRAAPATAGETLLRQAVLTLAIVLALIFLHGLEIWAYAVFYLWVGAFDGVEEALYFSASTFSTVGYGDVVMEGQWRLVSAIESVNGFVLIGWSTAVLVTVITRMRAAEDRWLAAGRDRES